MKIDRHFAHFAWGTLIYNLAVVLWGAFVRATGSGAGCGSHWPLCNGEVLPRAAQVETLIEFTHRITSGLALLFVIILFIWAFRLVPAGHILRLGASLALFFIITESLVGAALVRFEWVAGNVSMGRVVSMAVHLVNTFLLLASLALTAWWASGGERVRLRGQGRALAGIAIGFAGILILGVTGAITALGDTIFPASSLGEAMQQDFSPTSHFLIQLRIWHPVTAVVVGFYLAFVGSMLARLRGQIIVKRMAVGLGVLFVIQLLAGFVNVILLVPVPMQIIHLLLADAVWITFILLSAAALGEPADAPAFEVQTSQSAHLSAPTSS